MDKRKNTASHVLARFRGFIQAAATLVTNIHLPNFAKGGIYQGAGKTVCVPGLNCYSCPAASGACPIGSFQSVVGSSKFNFSYYVTGTLILLGVLLGRFVCGFLCPFGWLQELLHKIPGKKFSTKKLKPLTYIKYVVLLFAVGQMKQTNAPSKISLNTMSTCPQARSATIARLIPTWNSISHRCHRDGFRSLVSILLKVMSSWANISVGVRIAVAVLAAGLSGVRKSKLAKAR